MIVYRVEHESIKDPDTGHLAGPFQNLEVPSHLSLRQLMAYEIAVSRLVGHLNSDPDRYRTPAAEPHIGLIERDEICGVRSVEALHDWFGDSLPWLENCGFRISEYEVPDEYVKCGMTGQVVFRFKYAKKVEEKIDERRDA